ncbi:MAG: hypothetical protein ACREK4_07330 [Candidatus Rokuibacteriota bacterium]
MMRTMTGLLTVLGLGLAFLMVASSTAPAQSSTDGKVTLESKSVAIGVGVSWGDGVLEYRGKKYPFTVQGLSVLDLGVAKVTAKGDVKNLKKLEDFNGNYVLAAAGGAVGGGAGVAGLKNQNGVEMALTATGQGIKLSIAQGGVELKLKK